MTNEELLQYQNVQLDIMDEIHRICAAHQIEYYIIAGTLLGAVRHGGFIPWDCDMDIAMTRANYDRFKSVCAAELDSRFGYCDYTNVRGFRHPHAVVIIKNTNVITRYTALNPKAGDLPITLDIFPLDSAPDDSRLREEQAARLLRIRNFKKLRTPYTYSSSKIKLALRKVIRGAFFWLTVDKLNAMEDRIMQQYDGSPAECLCSMASHYSYQKQCMPKEIYGTPVLLPFAGREYYAPAMYRDYLTRLYGDYMKLPPEEEREYILKKLVAVEYNK